MRTLIDLPESELQALGQIARSRGMSRAEIVRQAVREYLARHAKVEAGFGLWRDQPVDGVEHQRRVREEW